MQQTHSRVETFQSRKNLPSMISSLTVWISLRTSDNSSCFHISRSLFVAARLEFPNEIVSWPVSDWKRRLQHKLLPAAEATDKKLSSFTVAKQYNLVPAKGRWWSMVGKVTVGLASHWPCVTDSVVYPPTGSMACKGRWAPRLRSPVEHGNLPDYTPCSLKTVAV